MGWGTFITVGAASAANHHRRWHPGVLVALMVSLVLPGASLGLAPQVAAFAAASAASVTTDSWPSYLHDAERTGASGDTTLSPANAAQLTKLWSYATGGVIAAQPAIVNGVVYVGSWDGYEYALNAATGAFIWKTYLGITTTGVYCSTQIGVTSSAAVSNGVVYVGGGDAYWYALDAATGNVLWKVYTGDNSATGGHYNWSSPLIYNGDAYIGIASFGDCPLVQGQLLQVNLSTHQVVNTLNIVPNGQVGGGIWTSPSVDPAINTIYVTTGTLNDPSQTLAQALLAIDATTLTITSYWQIPQQQTVVDSDWGTTPMLFTDQTGRQLVAATNKNGYLYAFLRSSVGSGPVWQRQIAIGGQCPTCGDGSVSSTTFGGGLLYAAGGNTTINGIGHQGSVRALDPASGNVVWEHPDPSSVLPALTYDNGLVIAGTGASLEVLDASTGARLYSYTTGTGLFGAAAVANGTIYFGSGDGSIYALALPATPPSPPPADPQCPTGWTCQDIGSPAPAGSETVAGSSWTITAGGAGVMGASDQFRFISQTASGDTQITAQAQSLATTGSGAQVGLMLRQSADPGAPYYAVFVAPNNTLVVRKRASFGGPSSTLSTVGSASLPRYLEIQRTGDTFQAATSPDGATYTLIPGTTATLVMPSAAMAGVAASSGVNGTAGSTTVGGAAIGAPTTPPTSAPSPSPCPSGWTCGDIGNPYVVGDQTLSNGVWSVSGGGNDIANYADQFHFAWQPLAADGTISARVTAQTNTSANAKAGVMLRQNASAGSAFYAAFATPGQGIVVVYRPVQGLPTAVRQTYAATLPAYLEVARSGNSFSTYSSSDGVTWSYVVGTSVLMNLSGTVLAGLAVTSSNGGASSTATFDSVAISTTAPLPPLACPTGWTCADIGNPLPSGDESLENGVWSVEGGGSDIWSVADEFHFDWQSLAGDGSLSAHVTAQSNTSTWAKAGLMLRASTNAGDPFYDVMVTPANGIVVQYRASAGASAQQAGTISGTVPIYLRIGRAGTTFTAYTSSDGANWTPIPGSSIALPNLAGTLLAGMAITSHAAGTLGLATFDTILFSSCPAGWSCQDVGGPALAGTQSASNGTWTVQGAGTDIWNTADQFRFAWQSLPAGGLISAHVVSQANTDPWAKAGVMLRADASAGAPYYDVVVTPANGIAVQYRPSAGASAQNLALIAGTAPTYLRIGRSGTTFSAYTSSDGATWTLIPGSVLSLPNLTGTLLAGLAVTSHNGGAFSTVTFDTVSFSTCPPGWSCADVGAPALAGSQAVSNGTWTIQGAGSDIWNTSDQFHFVWQSFAADGSFQAHVTSQTNTDSWAKAGVMLRLSTDPGAPFYAVYVTPANGITVQFRTAQGASAQQAALISGSVPAYLEVGRSGTTFTAYTSPDGVTWTPIPGSTVTLANLTGTLQAGLAVTSHNAGALSTAVFDSVSVSTCPAAWTCQDIGSPALAGSQSASNGTWTVQGAGSDIWNTADQFHYVWQPLAADGSLSAHVTAQTNTSAWAKAGVMLRLSTDPGAPYYAILVTPANGIVVQLRSAQGATTQQIAIAGTVPVYLRVARSGTTFTAYTSSDGATWTPIAGSTLILGAMTGTLLAGIAVTSHNGGALSAVTLDSVALSGSASPPPATCPTSWTCADIGYTVPAGSQALSNGTWTVQGAGSDIWNTADQFRFVWQSLAADGGVAVHVTAQTNTSTWAKAGVMLRLSTDPGAPFYAVYVTPANGINVQYRAAQGTSAQQAVQISGAAPAYLKVAHSGTTFTAYTSSDGVTWTPISGSTVTLANLSGTLLAGLAVTSHNGGTLCTATFDGVSIG